MKIAKKASCIIFPRWLKYQTISSSGCYSLNQQVLCDAAPRSWHFLSLLFRLLFGRSGDLFKKLQEFIVLFHYQWPKHGLPWMSQNAPGPPSSKMLITQTTDIKGIFTFWTSLDFQISSLLLAWAYKGLVLLKNDRNLLFFHDPRTRFVKKRQEFIAFLLTRAWFC